MKNKLFGLLLVSALATSLWACGAATMAMDSQKEFPKETQKEMEEKGDLFDKFVAGEIDAYDPFYDRSFKYSELDTSSEDFGSYREGVRKDLDNDGEDEFYMDGPFGGMILDIEEGKLVKLDEGEGAAGEMSFATYQDKLWVVHSDTSHAGREVYRLTLYKGSMAAEINELMAEYWENESGTYDENSSFSYKGEKISMMEYEALKKEILGQ